MRMRRFAFTLGKFCMMVAFGLFGVLILAFLGTTVVAGIPMMWEDAFSVLFPTLTERYLHHVAELAPYLLLGILIILLVTFYMASKRVKRYSVLTEGALS
jgi:uncharacterized BrkB/YihY/UPF0761 family membrane protein